MRKLFIAVIILSVMLFIGVKAGWATEEVPAFAGVPVFPNVMFIFDTSDSMREAPYLNQYGGAYTVPSWRWKTDIKLDANGNPLYSGDGFQTYSPRAADPNPDAYLSGGDHPASKLFQAKKALRQVLSGIDNVNMGFSTYLQERRPRVRALYYYIEPANPGTTTPDRWLVKYRKWVADSNTYADNASPTRLSYCGTYNDFVGFTFTCNDTQVGCPRTRNVRVYNIQGGFGTDGSLYRHFITVFAHYQYQQVYYNVSQYANCSSVPQTLTGGWEILPADQGTDCKKCLFVPGTTTGATPAYYRFSWSDTTGSWSVSNPSAGGYINPTTLQVTPNPTSGSWQLVTSNLTNVPVNTATPQATANAYPTQFDSSYFRYPADGTTNKPNAWSYLRTSTTASNQFLSNRTWPNSIQRNPYFPDNQAVDDYLGNATELDNYSGDDNIFFVHLPDPDTGDDSAMANRDKIMSFLSLNRATDPRYNCRVTGSVVGFCPGGGATPYQQFTTMPYTTSIPPSTESQAPPCATPLGATLQNVKKYYQSYFEQDNQTQIGCRENYVILLTDGLETCGGNAPAAAAQLLNLKYHQGQVDERDTPVKTYVIGFGLSPASASALNDIAEAGGTDEAFFATTLQDLIATLTNIFQAITAGSYTRSDPVISREGNSIYAAYFDYPGWKGHVVKYLVDANGNVTSKDSAWYNDPNPAPDDVLEGDAGARLNETAAAARTIYTTTTNWTGSYPPPSRLSFDVSNMAALHTLLNPGDFNEDAATNQTDSTELINYIRDVGYNGGAYAWATRDPTWKLGDIYHSTPVVVTPPQFDIGYLDYDGFKTDHATRASIVLAGANDGMFHAFNNADGTEEWAYIPKNVLGRLKNLKNGQTYGVDLAAKAADIWSAGGGSTVFPSAGQNKDGWHTVVIGGLRQGGNYYFALDISDTTSSFPKPLWELTDTCLGETWSSPTFGRVKVSGVDKYVAFVGGGYSTDNNVGNSLYIINIEEGNFLKKFTQGTAPPARVGSPREKIPSAVRAVDLNRDGYIERVYVANTSGKLYKLDLTSEDTSNWAVIELFDPGTYDYSALPTNVVPAGASLPGAPPQMRRPVFYPPAVIKDRYGEQHYFILYGTGNDMDPQAQNTQDFFFEIEDLDTGAGGGQCNWVYVFCSDANPCMVGNPPAALVGEKCLSRPVAFNYVVYFTTYSPTQVCGAGQGFIYGLTISRGSTTGGEGALQYDLAGNELETPVEHTEVGGIVGIPSSPVVTNGMIYFNASSNTNVNQLRIPVLAGQLRSWQEVF